MQTCLKIFLHLLLATSIVGCSERKDEEADKKAIQRVVSSYQEAFNQKDAAKLAAEWASDATYINPVTGETAEGKEAIEKLFREKFADNKKRNLTVKIKKIEFPNIDEAIEHGVMNIAIEDQPEETFAYKAEYVKEDGQWKIQEINEIELQKPSSNAEKLKDLAWLVGKWEDTDDNVEILFDNQWDKYKNFLTQHFQMKIHENEDFEGKQIIAWDSVKNVIRSWVFDSDGEFGEGTWEKVDKSWQATMHYTLSDGRKASSKNIFTPIDDNNYTFSSIDRVVDGENLPDMNPVTVRRR